MTMTPREAVKAVNEIWVYSSDGPLDHWNFRSPGDCENYALLVLKNIYGSKEAATRALIFRKSYIWFVKSETGEGHAVLEHEGKFVDNNYRHWLDSQEQMSYYFKYRYSSLAIAGKLGFGALFGW
jgi:predicted transglutaminase-like cysteine proteinase